MAAHDARHDARDDPAQCRGGFAMPLAILVILALALISALGVEAALGALRSDTAGVVEAQAAVRAETGLATALAHRVDSAALRGSAGTVLFTLVETLRDTVTVVAQVVEPGVARVVVTAIVRRAQFRGIAGRYAFTRLVVDSATPGRARLRPLPANWWAAMP